MLIVFKMMMRMRRSMLHQYFSESDPNFSPVHQPCSAGSSRPVSLRRGQGGGQISCQPGLVFTLFLTQSVTFAFAK